MTAPTPSDSRIFVRNYTETRSIEKRLYALGDIRLLYAPTYQWLGFFSLFAVLEYIVLKVLGVSLEPQLQSVWFWTLVGLPPFLATAATNVKMQGKSFADYVFAQMRFAYRWLARRLSSRGTGCRVVVVLWHPTDPAYRWIGSGAFVGESS